MVSDLVSYYRDANLNPVPIDLHEASAWELHIAKRRNLYERHLGIPLSLLRGRSVLEFGCNSGENALVLAHFGADLTLVEPNALVRPRLEEQFKRFGLSQRIIKLVHGDIGDFQSDSQYDVVIAEGFLNALENRDEMLQKMCRLLAPGGFAVISFDDRYGNLLELTRKLVYWRAYRLEGIDDAYGPDSLELARLLFLEDFSRLNASRPFEAWWGDVLMNPFVDARCLWSFQEALPLLEDVGCEFHASSPSWVSAERFNWYKNIMDRESRHHELLEEWPKVFSFTLTGIPPMNEDTEPASPQVVDSVLELTASISSYIREPKADISAVSYPSHLDDHLGHSADPRVILFNKNMKKLLQDIRSDVATEVISAYHTAEGLRSLWGVSCHYLCISKSAN